MKHDDINKLAHLARINISKDTIEDVTQSINNILTLVDQLQQVDTKGVLPMSHPLETPQPLRVDEVTEENCSKALQHNAPATENGLFLVPKVID
ncbi:asparaginyl/glutamyl-tRNA amidotransferase subunit C [Candidatus Endobugula sertula]|uniref:Aspartyl/glutamyl-tRNA(Asn/Gln) amidotransferase subunit C n=1 Tax=Candidatus Endobugula sertula TaxID=62101 RepID=A0A1D2QQN0_9GAMM|nr:asparaginyl/glutamyl-tRNA amidotransferase subunit C [Candidatus Endobugula sertula]